MYLYKKNGSYHAVGIDGGNTVSVVGTCGQSETENAQCVRSAITDDTRPLRISEESVSLTDLPLLMLCVLFDSASMCVSAFGGGFSASLPTLSMTMTSSLLPSQPPL